MNHPNIQVIDVAEASDISPIMLYPWRGELLSGKIKANDQKARSINEIIETEKKIK